MAVLRPYPFAGLARRMFRELEERGSIFDLPGRAFFRGEDGLDLSVRFHGKRAGTPLGPAAGPQSQMAQNLVLSWLGGGRIHELKTVQVNDELVIGRPCIDVQTVGYNIEWSQELKLEESRAEYVKGAMLVRMLQAAGVAADESTGDTSGRAAATSGSGGHQDTLWDMSVGYDLAGIRSERVQAFIKGMLDAGDLVERFRAEIPDELARFRDLDFPTRLSDTLTLSTFHGCPSDEIERIIDFLLHENRLHCIVKLNPMLLGPAETRRLLHDVLGYHDLCVPDSAFERDTKWDQMEEFVERLGATAAGLGLGFGVKFSNTLIVENHRDFFPAREKEMYLSGQPLHVLAMSLVGRFRERFGTRFPISFAAGIDKANLPDAVALGLVPVTVCTDLLRPGGYARAHLYLKELGKRMREVGAATVDQWVLRAYGHEAEAMRRAAAGGGDPVAEAALLNTRTYVERVTADPRYHRAANETPPKKIGRHLKLFDCITCDKCVPVCPNDANFTFELPKQEIPIVRVRKDGDAWTVVERTTLTIGERHQIGNFADFCNDCGNCDVFCPEDGGPYAIKPRFFGSREAWEEDGRDGFFVDRQGDGTAMILGRFAGAAYRLELRHARLRYYSGTGFEVTFDPADPAGTLSGEASGTVDLAYAEILARLASALAETQDTWIGCLAGRR